MAGNVAADLSGGGDWLFRQGELVLGPVNAAQLVQKLYSGELDGQSEVAPLGDSRFRRVAEVELFKVELAKAEAKRRVDALARTDRARAARKRTVIISAVAVVAVVVAIGAAAVAQYVAVHNPFKSAEYDEGITVSPPQITLAKSSRRNNEELLDYAGPKRITAPPTNGNRTNGTGAVAGRTGGKTGTGSVTEEPDGLQMASFDQEGINSVVAANQRKLFTCFREESGRDPSFAAKIPLEFVIGADGKVVKLWVDHPSYKTGPLADCLLRELQKWPFKPTGGEQPSVSLSFTIGKRG